MTANRDASDFEENLVSFQDFSNEVSDPGFGLSRQQGSTSESNRICFLIGKVGRGKTLLLSIVNEFVRSRPWDIEKVTPIPVNFDFEALWRDQDSLLKDIDDAFYEKLYRQIELVCFDPFYTDKTKMLDFQLRYKQVIESTNPRAKISVIACHLADLKYSLHLTFDNTDRFHFGSSKYSFFEEYKYAQIKSIERNLLSLIRSFTYGEDLGHLGCSVLIICRRHVYEHLRSFSDGCGSNDVQIRDYTVFTIKAVDVEEIVTNRLKLLNDATKEICKAAYPNSDELELAMRELNNALTPDARHPESARRVLRVVHGICHHGLRSFVDFVGNIGINQRDGGELINRLFQNQTHNLLRLYFTNMRRRFTERQEHFPNIFLVNASDEKNSEYEAAHRPHRHSYWLRYLILRYLLSANGRGVQFSEIHDYFVEKGGYEDHLFRLQVGMLADPRHGACIEVSYDRGSIDGRKMSLSRRGRHMIGTSAELLDDSTVHREDFEHLEKIPLCFGFDYLQLVIDDPDLRIPDEFVDQVFCANTQISLWYTLKKKEEYSRNAWRYLEIKTESTLIFLRILQASFKVEKKRHPYLFRDGQRKWFEPDFESISDSLIETFNRILNHFPGGPALAARMSELQNSLAADTHFDLVLTEAYGS